MSFKDKPKAAKFRKIESFFNKPAVEATNASNSRSAAANVESAAIIERALQVRDQTSAESEQNDLGEEENEAEDHDTQENQTNVEEDESEDANCARESDFSQSSFSMYRGFRMNIGSIVLKAGGSRVLSTYTKKLRGSRKRLMAKCLLCNEFNDVSVQNSGRKKVPIADGIRCDSKEKLQYIQ